MKKNKHMLQIKLKLNKDYFHHFKGRVKSTGIDWLSAFMGIKLQLIFHHCTVRTLCIEDSLIALRPERLQQYNFRGIKNLYLAKTDDTQTTHVPS